MASLACPLPLKRRRIESSECVSDASSARLSPVVLFSAGPGCTGSSDWMIRWKQLLKDNLDAVEVFPNYDCLVSDDPCGSASSLQTIIHSERAEDVTMRYRDRRHPLVLAGRSLGAKMSCLVTTHKHCLVAASAVICFGYPIEGMLGAAEDDLLTRLKVPVIFIQGSRDVFCPLDKLEALRKKMTCYNELHVVDEGNHSLVVGKKHLLANRLTQDDVEAKVAAVVASFITNCLRGDFAHGEIHPFQAAPHILSLNNHNKDAKDASQLPVVVFAPGTSTPTSSNWMIRWRVMLKNVLDAVEVITFDYPYMSGPKKKSPPKAERLVKFHKDIVKQTVEKYPGHPLILVGKAAGARVSCMVANEVDITASAVICFGYPLKSIIRATNDDSLMELNVPVMFVQGSSDVFCPLDMLQAVQQKLKCRSAVHVVDGGDHSFRISNETRKEDRLSQHESDMGVVEAIASFVSGCLKRN